MPIGVVDTVGGDLPLPVGGGLAVGVPPTDVDLMVDRIAFWLAVNADSPYERQTAQFQRDQVDQQPEAGEQSLAGWWVRSQMSFHMGAGLDFLDTAARPDELDRLRFRSSRNVDVWTPGQVTRLNGTSLIKTVGGTEQLWLEPITTGLVMARDSKVEVYDGTSWTELTYGSAFPIRAFATDGAYFYVATIDGVYKRLLDGTGTSSKVYSLPSTDVPMCLGWVKQRLMLGHGAKVYELDVAAAAAALPTAKLTHPVGTWKWTAFTDSPTGILAYGYAGLQSGGYRFALSEVAGAPVLGAGVAALSMPAGEQILSALYYMGGLLVLGTNRGVRVCAFDTYQSSITLGPLSVESGPVTALGGYDRFVFAGCTLTDKQASGYAGEPVCVRVDLSAPLSQAGHYAWAPDLPFASGAVTALAFRDDGGKYVGLKGVGVYTELTAPGTDDAWLETARIRMGTVEDKHWMYGTIRGSFVADASPVTVWSAGPATPWGVAQTVTSAGNQRWRMRLPKGEWAAFRFYLTGAAQLSSYQLQALPAGKRQRLLSLPVSVSDFQLTRSGIEVGYRGWALERLAAIEALEEAGAEVTITCPALFTEAIRGVVEQLQFRQTATGEGQADTAGVLQVVIRTTS